MNAKNTYTCKFETVLSTELAYLNASSNNSLLARRAFIKHWITYISRYIGLSRHFFPDEKIDQHNNLWIINDVMLHIITKYHTEYNLSDMKDKAASMFQDFSLSEGPEMERKGECFIAYLESNLHD
jgi:hypothetical protein